MLLKWLAFDDRDSIGTSTPLSWDFLKDDSDLSKRRLTDLVDKDNFFCNPWAYEILEGPPDQPCHEVRMCAHDFMLCAH